MGLHTGIPLTTDVAFNHTTGHMAYSGGPLKVRAGWGGRCTVVVSVMVMRQAGFSYDTGAHRWEGGVSWPR